MSDNWETQIGGLLAELSATQSDLLTLLGEKRACLVANDSAGLQALQNRESELTKRLQACHEQRQQLLSTAAAEGLPADSIQSLADCIASADRAGLRTAVDDSRRKARLLQHESLANWVIIQRSVLHLSQMLEIIATGGQLQPTYGDGAPGTGALVDQAV